MNLNGFTILFVVLSTLLAFGFAVWCWVGVIFDNEAVRGLVSLASFAAGIGLLSYGINTWKKFQKDEFKSE